MSAQTMVATERYMVDVSMRREERYDLARLIREHRDEYVATDLRGGYQEWERPSVFLHQWVEESEGCDDLDFHWSERHYADLIEACPEAVVGDELEDPGVPCPACEGGRKIHEPGCLLEAVVWVTDGKQPKSARGVAASQVKEESA